MKKNNNFEFNEEAITFTEFWMKKYFFCMTQESQKRANSFDDLYGVPISIIPFERPDVFVLFKDAMFALEHFRFDSSKTKKGSSLLQEEKAHFQKKLKKGLNIKKVENEANISYYKKNLMRSTFNHADKYDSYMENIASKGGVILNEEIKYTFHDKVKEFGFITQDISVDYNMYRDNGTLRYITPFHIKEFREFIRENKNIKHFFHLVFDSEGKEVSYYFFNHENNIDKLDEIMYYDSPKEIETAKVFLWKYN